MSDVLMYLLNQNNLLPSNIFRVKYISAITSCFLTFISNIFSSSHTNNFFLACSYFFVPQVNGP